MSQQNSSSSSSSSAPDEEGHNGDDTTAAARNSTPAAVTTTPEQEQHPSSSLPKTADATADRPRKALWEDPICRMGLGALAIVNVVALIGILIALSIVASKTDDYECECVCPTTTTNNAAETTVTTTSSSTRPSTHHPPEVAVVSTTVALPPEHQVSLLLGDDVPDSTWTALEDFNSPQSQAWRWLEGHPNLAVMDEYQRRQLFALVTIYYSFHGDSWPLVNRTHWLDYSIPECQWVKPDHSVLVREVCDYSEISGPNTEFETLFLGHIPGLYGSMPPEIAFLTGLYALGIYDCPDLVGPLENVLPPLGMESLSYLFYFDNQLSGTIPADLGLMELSGLSLQGNRLTSTIPSELGNPSGYKDEIFLHDNNLVGSVPDELCNIGVVSVDCSEVTCSATRCGSCLCGTDLPE
jgi:hypothetical protein